MLVTLPISIWMCIKVSCWSNLVFIWYTILNYWGWPTLFTQRFESASPVLYVFMLCVTAFRSWWTIVLHLLNKAILSEQKISIHKHISIFNIQYYICRMPIKRKKRLIQTIGVVCFCTQIVKEYERAIIFRLGRILRGGAKGPGQTIFYTAAYIFYSIHILSSFIKMHFKPGSSVCLSSWIMLQSSSSLSYHWPTGSRNHIKKTDIQLSTDMMPVLQRVRTSCLFII